MSLQVVWMEKGWTYFKIISTAQWSTALFWNQQIGLCSLLAESPTFSLDVHLGYTQQINKNWNMENYTIKYTITPKNSPERLVRYFS